MGEKLTPGAMERMNRSLKIREGAQYWMDWKRETSEKAQPMKVIVEDIFPHVIIVKDKYGRRIGIPAASAVLDLRLTKHRQRAKHQEKKEQGE